MNWTGTGMKRLRYPSICLRGRESHKTSHAVQLMSVPRFEIWTPQIWCKCTNYCTPIWGFESLLYVYSSYINGKGTLLLQREVSYELSFSRALISSIFLFLTFCLRCENMYKLKPSTNQRHLSGTRSNYIRCDCLTYITTIYYTPSPTIFDLYMSIWSGLKITSFTLSRFAA